MKKRARTRAAAVIVMAALLCLICGCAGGGEQFGSNNSKASAFSQHTDGNGDIVRFDDIEYIRPDVEQFRQAVDDAEQALSDGSSLRKVESRLDKCYEAYYDFDTMYTLSEIRAYQDMTDEFYAEEYNWCEDSYPLVQQLMEELLYACGGSDRAQELEEGYFWEGFAEEYADESQSVYNDELVALMQQESALLAEYRATVAAPTIQTSEGEVDYHDYIADKYDEEYREALLKYYEKYNGELSRIYIDLVNVRHQLAAEMGYDSYEQMQYDYFFYRDYAPESAAGYIADIKEYMVPFYKEVMETDPYSSVSYDYLTDRQLMNVLTSAAERVGGNIEEAFRFMHDYGYYDVKLSTTKADMSFQTYLASYEAPFLFLNPSGDVEDILSFSHEFGHYVDAYVNYNASETIDVSECFSQAMEYLLLGYYDDALNDEAVDNLFRLKMLDTMELYVQQASFAEFESVVYSTDPELLSADMLNDLSLRLAVEYGYYDGVSEEYYAMSWTDIAHFFEMPFYVITYPVSNDIAMQIYELEQQKTGLGLEKYLEILPREYEGLIDTAEAGGLSSPFEPGRIEKVVDDMRRRLIWQQAA